MDKLNILILHQMGDPKYWRSSVRDLEFMLPEYAQEHHYIVHDGNMPLPKFVKDIEFHGIVLGPTFLCNRYDAKTFARALRDYAFIRTSNAFKIALPQDDYDCSAILDRWMVDWGVDIIYSVLPGHWDVLYPNFLKIGRINPGYTGYISEQWIELWKSPKPFEAREIDVSYRASKLPPNFGRIGHVKGIIGDLFVSNVDGLGLKLNISTDPRDMIPGERWHEFIENSKFCLVTNSGSSLLDPEGEIRRKVHHYLVRFPSAGFDEVEKNCFPDADGKYIFTAISPRNIEAALAKTTQIATPGSYNGIFKEMEHYIPLEPDCSNIRDVIKIMKDRKKIEAIATNCKEAVLSVDALRFKNHVPKLIQQITKGVITKGLRATGEQAMMGYTKRYQVEIISSANAYWIKRRALNRIRSFAVMMGVQKLKHFIVGGKVGVRII